MKRMCRNELKKIAKIIFDLAIKSDGYVCSEIAPSAPFPPSHPSKGRKVNESWRENFKRKS